MGCSSSNLDGKQIKQRAIPTKMAEIQKVFLYKLAEFS